MIGLASNLTYRRDLVATAYGKAFDELYSYDGLHRLATFYRGILNPAGTAISDSDYGREHRFAGRELDGKTGLQRHRDR